MNDKYKVGDLVKLKNISTVPTHLHGALALVSAIVEGNRANYHLSYDTNKPVYILYINDSWKELFWEEAEFELALRE